MKRAYSQISQPMCMARKETVLIVAEKRLVAQAISEFLSGGIGRYITRTVDDGDPGCKLDVHEFDGVFLDRECHFRVISTYGHVFNYDFPWEYRRNWDHLKAPCDPEDLFHCPIELVSVPCDKPKSENDRHQRSICEKTMRRHLATEARGCKYLILFLDCDRAGERICFEVIKAVRLAMRLRTTDDYFLDADRVFRADFCSITKNEIIDAMRKLGVPDWNLARSAQVKTELDLRVGCPYTRVLTQYFKNRYSLPGRDTLSFGPCQILILALCVDRVNEIKEFKPEPFWSLQLELELPETGVILSLNLLWEPRGRVCVPTLFEWIKERKYAYVTEIIFTEYSKKKPKALSSFELYRALSRYFGQSPKKTAEMAQNLYEKGKLTYPRTGATTYPDNFIFKEVISKLSENPEYEPIIRGIEREGIDEPRNDESEEEEENGKGNGEKKSKPRGHPPITPKELNYRNSKKRDNLGETRVYDYVIRHFFATLKSICLYEETIVKFEVEGQEFSVLCRKVLKPGFTSVLNEHRVKECNLPFRNLQIGDPLRIRNVELKYNQTSPPGHLLEADLITKMEDYKIGTNGTLPKLIDEVCEQGYVEVVGGRDRRRHRWKQTETSESDYAKDELEMLLKEDKETERRLVPTKLGIALIRGIRAVDPELVNPIIREQTEQLLECIAEGKMDPEEVKECVLQYYREKFEKFKRSIVEGRVNKTFEGFSTLEEAAKPLSMCGICLEDGKLLRTRPPQFYCPECKIPYELPDVRGNDAFERHPDGERCSRDDFELIRVKKPITAGSKRKSDEYFCPRCYHFQRNYGT